MNQYIKGVERRLHSELNQLNRIIDYKIMRGLGYTTEARKHKMVLAKLYKTERSQRSSVAGFPFLHHVFS